MSAVTDDKDERREGDAVSKGGKTRLLTLGDLDGRTTAARMVAASIEAIEADLGEDLSNAERAIVRRAAMAGAMSESLAAQWLQGEPVEPAAFATLANLERRQLEVVGIKRRPRDVSDSLRAYVARTNSAGASNG